MRLKINSSILDISKLSIAVKLKSTEIRDLDSPTFQQFFNDSVQGKPDFKNKLSLHHSFHYRHSRQLKLH